MRASRPAPSWLPQWTMTESVVGTSRPAFAGNAGALGMPAGPPPVRPIRYVVSPGTGRRAAASPATASAVTARSWRSRASRPPSASPAQPPRRTALLGAAAGGARRQSPARAPRVRAAVPARGDDPELCGPQGSRRSIRFVPGNRDHVAVLGQQPQQRELPARDPAVAGQPAHLATRARLRSGCSPWKRGSRWRRSSCVSPSVVSTAPVGNRRPSALTAPGRSPA